MFSYAYTDVSNISTVHTLRITHKGGLFVSYILKGRASEREERRETEINLSYTGSLAKCKPMARTGSALNQEPGSPSYSAHIDGMSSLRASCVAFQTH